MSILIKHIIFHKEAETLRIRVRVNRTQVCWVFPEHYRLVKPLTLLGDVPLLQVVNDRYVDDLFHVLKPMPLRHPVTYGNLFLFCRSLLGIFDIKRV